MYLFLMILFFYLVKINNSITNQLISFEIQKNEKTFQKIKMVFKNLTILSKINI